MKRNFFISLITLILVGCTLTPLKEKQGNISSYQPGVSHNHSSQRVVLVGGCFDLLHLGHVRFLSAAKEQGDYLVVALEPDSRIIKYKKRQPVHNQQQRAEILSHLRMVDEVLLLPELHGFSDYLELVKTVHPQVIAATKGDPQVENKSRQAVAVGAKMVEVVDRLEPFSSTAILKNHGLTKAETTYTD